jgi:hypothetical protein
MTKLAIAAIALGLAGAGALAAVGVKRLSCGECPLSGAPIAHASQSNAVAPADGPATNSMMMTTGGTEAACPTAQASAVAKPDCPPCPECPQSEECVTDCEENPPPQCEEKRCEKKAPAENP